MESTAGIPSGCVFISKRCGTEASLQNCLSKQSVTVRSCCVLTTIVLSHALSASSHCVALSFDLVRVAVQNR